MVKLPPIALRIPIYTNTLNSIKYYSILMGLSTNLKSNVSYVKLFV